MGVSGDKGGGHGEKKGGDKGVPWGGDDGHGGVSPPPVRAVAAFALRPVPVPHPRGGTHGPSPPSTPSTFAPSGAGPGGEGGGSTPGGSPVPPPPVPPWGRGARCHARGAAAGSHASAPN